MNALRPPFIIAGGNHPSDLAERVNGFWKHGYRPHGSIVISDGSANSTWFTFMLSMTYDPGFDEDSETELPYEGRA